MAHAPRLFRGVVPVFAALLAMVVIASVARAEGPAAFPGKVSSWHGGTRYDFKCAGRDAIVVLPEHAAEGKPWLWRGEFFGAFATVDEALLKKGWALAYLSCSNTYGSADTMKRWQVFYDLLTKEHGWSKRPVLLGMSRGGMYVYNWATLHPETVGMIYGDAPVCDARSWPGGHAVNGGIGKGSASCWAQYKQVYGFKNDAEAKAYTRNPIDELAPIAAAHIPIIHVIGDADLVVPPVENTMVLKKNYEALGGHVELIVKHGCKHHPHSLKDPTPIVEYILAHRIK